MSTVALLVHHLRTTYPLVYMGDKPGGPNHRDRATPLPIFQSFASAHPEIVRHDPTKRAGQRNERYATFRDVWLPAALGELLGADAADGRYARKRMAPLANGDHGPRRLKHWQLPTPRNAEHAFAGVGLAAAYDLEMATCKVDANRPRYD